MEKKQIPRHLFPLSDRNITDKWALDNYSYRCHFNSSVSVPIPEEGDVEAWKKEARAIAAGLKRDGIMFAEKEIILLCNTRFGYKLKGKAIQNVYDIITLLTESNIFKDDYETYLNMLHMFQYGIFRCAYNAWAVDAENKWLNERNLAYEPAPAHIKRKGKGFVYKLLVNRASNTLCVRFQHLSQRLHNEYVIVRDKNQVMKLQNYNIISHVFNGSYRGYIMRKKEDSDIKVDGILTTEDENSIVNLVRAAIKEGHNIKDITDVLKSFVSDSNKGKKRITR